MSNRLRPPVDSSDHIMGSESALITLIEFGDYECVYCAQAYGVVKSLEEALGERLRFVYRNFPLADLHPHAVVAAQAAEAAGAHGLFWPMHDMLYEHHDALTPRNLVRYAEEVGLDPSVFEYDVRTHRFRDKLRADLRSGALSGVSGTPTFFVNGQRHDGANDFDSLLAAMAGYGSELSSR